VNALTGATGYRWSGPDGFTSTSQNPTIANFTLAKAGRYTVEILAGTCVAQETSTIAEAIDAPNFVVAFTAPPVFCQGNTKTLSVSPIVNGFTYQWFEKTSGLISGAINTTLVVSSGGEYYYQGSVSGCTTIESSSVVINSVSLPTVDFNAPATSCAGQQVQFTDQSTAGTGATYLWTFGDGNSSTEKSPTHVYASATGSPFNVKLVVSYDGACPSELTKQIAITAAPAMNITNPSNTFIFCPGESLTLEVLGGFTNYLWNTGATTSSINVTTAGTYSVEVNSSGCVLFDDQVVTSHPATTVNILADPQQINAGETSQLQASGLISYNWTPVESLSNSTIPNPIATPLSTTLYTVMGPDANGCTVEGTIQISVKGDAVVNKLNPSNFFSPNGDTSNEFWVVSEIENYPQCGVTIYVEKGV
jgi:PKD repeat protein